MNIHDWIEMLLFFVFLEVVPSTARSYYNSDGLAIDSAAKGTVSPGMRSMTSTNIVSTTTMIVSSLNNSDVRHFNGTIVTKRILRKGKKRKR